MPALLQFLISATFIALSLGQTPPGTVPSTTNDLPVSYGTTRITPGIKLPLSKVASVPTISYPSSPNHTYQLLLVDLSIPTSFLNLSTLVPNIQTPLAAGISPGRTTRLHFWQTGLTFTSNGTLVNNTSPIAFYQPPAPPPGDIAHTYVFYLFESDASFTPPPAGTPFSQALVNEGENRMSFSVNRLASEVGVGRLVGATYFLAQNSSESPTTSASGTGGVSPPTTVPFLGSGSRSSLGLGGPLLTATVLVSAITWAA